VADHDVDSSLSLSLPGPMRTAAKAKLIHMIMLQQQQQSVSALASSLPVPMPPIDPPTIPCSDNNTIINNILVNVNVNDVLAGRGSKISHHPGNIAFREFVGWFKLFYMEKSNKLLFKAHMCAYIVDHVRTLEPPGRFLQKKPHTNNNNVWVEMGDEKAHKRRDKPCERSAELGMAQFHPQNRKGALVSAMFSGNENTTAGAEQLLQEEQEQDTFLAPQQYPQHDHDIAEASMDQQEQQFHTNRNTNHIPLGMAISESRSSNLTAEQQETNYFLTPYQDQYEY
jgi:hypothetical protein